METVSKLLTHSGNQWRSIVGHAKHFSNVPVALYIALRGERDERLQAAKTLKITKQAYLNGVQMILVNILD